MKIIVDAMGGDKAPDEIVKGAVMASEKYNIEIVLTGQVENILRSLEKMGKKDLPRGIEIANATEVINMDDDPVAGIRTKKDSSMVVGLNMLRDGLGDAMVSAGSTGALLSGATLIVKRINGIRRAALAPFIPNKGSGVMLIDCGANVECTSEYLLQFAFMGSYYTENVLGVKNPRIGLLNVGTERTKGAALQHETYELLEKAAGENSINFIGNVEASAVMAGTCDVVVCDGFSGNVLLKSLEGATSFFISELKTILTSNWRTKIAALLVKGQVMRLREKMDADKIGGTSLLGISKPVVKAHGSSNAVAVCSAIRQAVETVNAGVVQSIKDNIDRMKTDEIYEKNSPVQNKKTQENS